jgi:hypothetical protein
VAPRKGEPRMSAPRKEELRGGPLGAPGCRRLVESTASALSGAAERRNSTAETSHVLPSTRDVTS